MVDKTLGKGCSKSPSRPTMFPRPNASAQLTHQMLLVRDTGTYPKLSIELAERFPRYRSERSH